jgi:UDP-2,3-diacylglucosamine pyrophosphatase LpxH
MAKISSYHQSMHSLIVSDLHLADAGEIDTKRPLWKKFRRRDYFIDRDFSLFIKHMSEKLQGSEIELILNGDIFDFDSITAVPEKSLFSIAKYERTLGMESSENKSLYKIEAIIRDHALWFDTLSEFIHAGHHVIFVIGNHDIELYWPLVQRAIADRLHLTAEQMQRLRFCDWFYISQGDTLIEHGHQYDPYCMAVNPIYPIIKKQGEYKIRLPFGNLANRYMVNGMGLKNPHSDDSFVKSVMEFVTFFYKYEMRVQPFMIFTWFFGALRTLITSINEGLYPSQKDPLMFLDRIKQIAMRANCTSDEVLAMRENHAHPAVHRPFMVLRELWLDRAFLLMLIVWGCWQIFTTYYLFIGTSVWWFIVPLLVAIPFFIYYAHGVQSDVRKNAMKAFTHAPLSAKTVGVKRVVHGHTHVETHFMLDDIEYLNTGTWSPRFRDPECLFPFGEKHFVWIDGANNRNINLFIWKNNSIIPWSDGPVAEMPEKFKELQTAHEY